MDNTERDQMIFGFIIVIVVFGFLLASAIKDNEKELRYSDPNSPGYYIDKEPYDI